MARLSTHVLDTARGHPASGMTYILYRLTVSHGARRHEELAAGVTNPDGRTDQPLLEGQEFQAGIYELSFDAGSYLRIHQQEEAPFFEWITLRFAVSDASVNYHVPLLLSPWSYTTYRGS